MKILIFYTPRSKSTMLCHVLAKKFNLTPIVDQLTISRIANQNFLEYSKIIKYINDSTNSCVKVCANDFIDIKNKCINQDYRQIDFNSFDHIIFATRDDYVSTVLSYAYMDPKNQNSWHTRIGQVSNIKPYTIDIVKSFYLLRGYFLFNSIKEYIQSVASNSKFYSYEYESIDQAVTHDFKLKQTDFEIDLVANNIDYKTLATNYTEIAHNTVQIYNKMSTLQLSELNNPVSYFWKDFER